MLSGEVCGWILTAQLCLLLTAITQGQKKSLLGAAGALLLRILSFLTLAKQLVIDSSLSCFWGPVYWRNWLRSFIWRTERMKAQSEAKSGTCATSHLPNVSRGCSALLPHHHPLSLPLTMWGCTEDLGALFSSISHSKATGFHPGGAAISYIHYSGFCKVSFQLPELAK